MTGTEKQLKWANEIMVKVNKVFDWTIENAPSTEIKEYALATKLTVNSSYAGKVIDCFKDFQPTGIDAKDMQKVFAMFKSFQKVSENKF